LTDLRLLIVEDNHHLAEVLSDRLGARGFACAEAHTLASAENLLGAGRFDLMVLDLGLPDGDGLQWLQSRREAGPLPPTLILTARGALEDRLAGLNGGADDYLTKPFEVEELVARLRVMMRRPGPRAQPFLEVGALRFDATRRTGSCRGEPLELSRREADLLELLMRDAGSVVPRRFIEERLYSQGDSPTPNALEAIVSRLRRKIEAAGGRNLLHTVRGIGYLLRAA
jgi:two-component system, OmpR family, response regulator QseB